MKKIHDFLDLASEHYYNGSPIISNEQFDRLAESSGYNKIGSFVFKEGTGQHLYKMYSLQKYYEDEGPPPKLTGKIDCSPKIDGAAVSLLYVDGSLVRALTRGDGDVGQDITNKFLATKLVPHELSTVMPGVLQVTGELAAPNHVDNARNYAAGALNLKDIEEFKTRAVTFFAYNLQPTVFGSFSEDMVLLKEEGFNTIKDENIHNIYPCDGIVYRLDNVLEFENCGYTATFPRGAYALKEKGAAVETTLLDVIWQTGKTGKVTPVAILKPVMIGAATISRATLNNIAYIRALDLQIGDTVKVIRSGEIIPQIVSKA